MSPKPRGVTFRPRLCRVRRGSLLRCVSAAVSPSRLRFLRGRPVLRLRPRSALLFTITNCVNRLEDYACESRIAIAPLGESEPCLGQVKAQYVVRRDVRQMMISGANLPRVPQSALLNLVGVHRLLLTLRQGAKPLWSLQKVDVIGQSC